MSKDLFSSHAADYAKFRPTYPRALLEYIASFAEQKELAWDCATGNGQAALLLVNFFKKVYATDLSQQQIDSATSHPRIVYSVSPAEHTPFANDSFDLITIAQAYHWVNHELFAQEAKRVGKQNGIVAVIGYNLFRSSNKEVTKLIHDFYHNVTDPYWEPERKYVEELYQNTRFDFEEQNVKKTFKMQTRWSVQHVEGYINTWSAIKKFIKQNGFNPVDELIEEVKKVWGNQEIVEFDFPLGLRIGKIVK
jgi:ubiquinone/menaquinone biosynthesis C-methylase UbiE